MDIKVKSNHNIDFMSVKGELIWFVLVQVNIKR